jgi:hypothetical protein
MTTAAAEAAELLAREESGSYYSTTTPITSERLATGPINQWGFRLRFVTNSGNACRYVRM